MVRIQIDIPDEQNKDLEKIVSEVHGRKRKHYIETVLFNHIELIKSRRPIGEVPKKSKKVTNKNI